MKSWNITMITGLVGVLYFVLISLVFGPMNLVIGNQIAFIAVSILRLSPPWSMDVKLTTPPGAPGSD